MGTTLIKSELDPMVSVASTCRRSHLAALEFLCFVVFLSRIMKKLLLNTRSVQLYLSCDTQLNSARQ